MDDFSGILTSRVNIKRYTEYIVDNVLITGSTVSIDRQPISSARFEVTLSGCTISSGTVTVAGSTNETFSFSSNGVQLGTRDFTSVLSVSLSSISSGTINIVAVTPTGQRLFQEKLVYENAPVRFYAVDGKVRMKASGKEKIAQYKFMIGKDYQVLENDLMYAVSGIAGMTYGQVSFVDTIMDFDGGTHHLECEVKQP